MISPKQIFLSTSLGFLLSVWLVSHFGVACVWLGPLAILIALECLFLFKAARFWVLFILIGLALGYFRTVATIREWESNIHLLQTATNNFLTATKISGTTKALSKTTDEKKTFIIHTKTIWGLVADFSILLDVPGNSFIKEWDEIEYISRVLPIRESESFAFDKYFQSKSIYARSSATSVTILDNSSSWYDRQIFAIRDLFSSHISALFPPRTAAFLGGLLFGEKQNLDEKIDSDFKLSGLSHIVAVSGFNITILIVFFSALLRFFPTWTRVVLITSIVLVFNSLVGEQISALRATIMWLAGYYALAFDRRPDLFYVLLGTTVCFIIREPYTLNYDVSFHLSFLAVLGMMYTTDFFKKLFFWVPEFFGVREALIATLGALSFTFPVSIINFWQLPLLSPIANILATPLLPITMLVCFVSILVDLVSHTLAVWVGFLGWGLLEYILHVASFFAALKKTILQVDLAQYGFGIMGGYYLFIAYFILRSDLSYYTTSSGSPSSLALSWERMNDA